MITITTMRIVWLLRAETTTTTMLRLSSACVLRFTHSQNSVSFPVFAKLFAQTSICELIDLSMKGLTILPFLFLIKAKQTRPFCNGFFFCGMCLKKWSSYFFIPHFRSLRLLERFYFQKIARLQSNLFSPTKRKVQLCCSLVELYLIFTLAYVISSLSRNLRLGLLTKSKVSIYPYSISDSLRSLDYTRDDIPHKQHLRHFKIDGVHHKTTFFWV